MQSNLKGADFTEAKFRHHVSFTYSNLRGANFTQTDLTKADMEKARYNEQTIFPLNFDPDIKDMIFSKF